MKIIILMALVILPFIGWAQNISYTVKLKFDESQVSTVAFLQYRLNGKVTKDSSRMINGLFMFHGEVPYPIKAVLWTNKNNAFASSNGHMPDVLSFYLENGEINIKAKDSVKNSDVTGTKINAYFTSYKAFIAETEKALIQINAESGIVMKEKKDDSQFQNNFKIRYKKVLDNYYARQLEYVKQNPNSYSSAEALTIVAGENIDVANIAPMYESLNADVRNTKAGQDLGKSIEMAKATSIGASAPNFTQNDVNDKPVSLSDFRGKYVLLDFWASWCGPCRAENPNYVKAYQKYKDKGFTIFGVSLDKSDAKEAWLAAIKKDGLEWTQVSDLKYWYNEAAKQYGVRSIPQNYLLDPTGKIIAKNLRGEELQKKLEVVFSK